jgi:hypothetical protein
MKNFRAAVEARILAQHEERMVSAKGRELPVGSRGGDEVRDTAATRSRPEVRQEFEAMALRRARRYLQLVEEGFDTPEIMAALGWDRAALRTAQRRAWKARRQERATNSTNHTNRGNEQ